MKRFACGDIIPGCDSTFTAPDDAGILAQADIPTAMLFVRNPSGISHSPEEKATMSDCLAGVEALADTLARLAT